MTSQSMSVMYDVLLDGAVWKWQRERREKTSTGQRI